MKARIASAAIILALLTGGCASPVQKAFVIRTSDGPPAAEAMTETLTGFCGGRKTELQFVYAREEAPGRMELLVEGRKVADFSDTPLGRDWTARSLITRKAMRCSASFLRLAAVGVQIRDDGTGQLVYSEASVTDGKVTHYLPFFEKDADYWKAFNQ